MVLDMFCHWNYVLENLFGRVEAVTAKAVTHIPERWDEQRRALRRHRRRRGVRHLRARRRHHRAGQLVAGRCGSSARSSSSSRSTARTARRWPGCSTAASSPASAHPDAGVEPRPAHHRGLPRPVARDPGQPGVRQRLPRAVGAVPARRARRAPAPLRLHPSAVRGLELVEAGLQSSAEGRRIEIETSAMTHVDDRRSIALPDGGGTGEPSRSASAGAVGRPPGGRSHPRWRSRRPTSSPTRCGENVPGAPAVVDWDATLAFRRELFRYGFGVAEAMDTAQRNMGLDWPAVQELVRRSAEQAARVRRPDRVRRRHRPPRRGCDRSTRCATRTPSRSSSSSRPARR